MTVNLNPCAQDQLLNMLSQRLGLQFADTRKDKLIKDLEEASRALGFENFTKFVSWFVSNEPSLKQLSTIASFVTIGETYFFRDPEIFELLQKKIFPELAFRKRSTTSELNIWSAACSTGEETYSLAITVCKSIPDYKSWKIKIFGTDISSKSLDKCKEGVYRKWSFREALAPEDIPYFNKRDDGTFKIADQVKTLTQFQYLNLNDFCLPPGFEENKFDIIFCRNVFLYFAEETAKTILNRLIKCLNEEGYLFLSATELAFFAQQGFTVDKIGNVSMIRKSQQQNNSQIKNSGNKFQALRENTIIEKNKISGRQKLETKDKKQDLYISGERKNPLINSTKIASTEKEHATINNKSLDQTISNIKSLANKGSTKDALKAIDLALQKFTMEANLYYIKALILLDQDKNEESITSFKKAIYLDPHFVMAHFQLGNLYNKEFLLKDALKHYENARNSLNKLKAKEIIPESDGLSVEQLNSMLTSLISSAKNS